MFRQEMASLVLFGYSCEPLSETVHRALSYLNDPMWQAGVTTHLIRIRLNMCRDKTGKIC